MEGRGYYPTNANGQNGTIPSEYNIHGTNADMQIYYNATWNTSVSGGSWQNYDLYNNNTNPDALAIDDMYGGTGAFLKEMADYKGDTIAVIKLAEGGTSLNNNWQSSGATYLTAKAWLEDALDKFASKGRPIVKCVSWLQGWSDMDTEANSDAYQANLEDLISRINTVIDDWVLGFNGKWLIHQSPDWVNQYATRPDAYQQTVRSAQQTVGESEGNLFIDNSGITIWSGDDLHYTGQTFIDLGVDRFDLLKDL
jgi:hypothetical protein